MLHWTCTAFPQRYEENWGSDVGVGNYLFTHLLDIILQWCTPSNPLFKRCTLKTPLPKTLFSIFRKMLALVLLLTNEIIPWNLYLLEKLIVPHLVRKLPPLYGTRRVITVVTKARHVPLCWTSWVESTPFHPTFARFVLILPSHLGLMLASASGPFPSRFSTKILVVFLFSCIQWFRSGKSRWYQCINAEWDYFEVDGGE